MLAFINKMTVPFRNLTHLALVASAFAALAATSLAQEIELIPSGPLTYDQNTGEIVATEGAQIVYDQWLLSADTIRFNRETGDAFASGNVVFTRQGLRLLAESLTYKPETQFARAEQFRAGNGRVYVDGAVLEGNPENFRFEDINFYPGEPGTFLFIARAGELAIVDSNEIRGRRLFFKVGAVPFLLIPNITQPLDAETNLFKPTLDYSGHIGALIGAEALAPVSDRLRLGGNLALTSQRGILAGPAARYSANNQRYQTKGSLISGYIDDQGDAGDNLFGEPIDSQRYFVEWQHKQMWAENRANLSTYARYWSDSEVTRDFYEDSFALMQDPDSYLEANYNASNWQLSLFARAALGDFQTYTERLPEVRFTYFPTRIGYGFSHSGFLSAAQVQTQATRKIDLSGTKFDAHYGLEWNRALRDGMTLRFKAGARNLSYEDAETYLEHYRKNGDPTPFIYQSSDSGSRGFADLGVDLLLKAHSTFEFKNETWNIDGIRHIVEPRLSYRYTPELWSSQALETDYLLGPGYNAPIGGSIARSDYGAFANYLPSIDLENRRDTGNLREDQKIRFELRNRIQTRHEDGGSRDLARFDLSADYYLPGSEIAEEYYSLINLDLEVKPATWFELGSFTRLDPEDGMSVQEFNARIALLDPGYWRIEFGSHFLDGQNLPLANLLSTYQGDAYPWQSWPNYGRSWPEYRNLRIEQYFAHLEYQFSENLKLYATARFDNQTGVFYEQRIGLMQRALQNYGLKYELRIYDGARRESDFGISIGIDVFDN